MNPVPNPARSYSLDTNSSLGIVHAQQGRTTKTKNKMFSTTNKNPRSLDRPACIRGKRRYTMSFICRSTFQSLQHTQQPPVPLARTSITSKLPNTGGRRTSPSAPKEREVAASALRVRLSRFFFLYVLFSSLFCKSPWALHASSNVPRPQGVRDLITVAKTAQFRGYNEAHHERIVTRILWAELCADRVIYEAAATQRQKKKMAAVGWS